MSAVSKSLILGTLTGALSLGACGGDSGGGGGTGAPQGGAGAMSGAGGAGGTNPTAGAGAMGGNAGMIMTTAGNGGMTGGVGASGTTGGTNPQAGSGGEPMCPFDVMCSSENDIRTGSACEDAASGVFAIKTVIDVWWQDDVTPPLVDPGRGKITVYLKGTLTDVCSDGSSGCGEMMGCGTVLPPFVSWVNCTAYQITFPDDLWEKPEMPKFYTTGGVDKFEPGGILNIAKATGLIGFTMEDADNAAWPTSIDTVACPGMAAGDPTSCFPNHDGDMYPGVSIVMGGIGTNFKEMGCCADDNPLDPACTAPVKFQGAPLDALLTGLCDPSTDPNCKRATKMSIGLRTRLGGGGEIAECDASGAAHGKGASDADYLDSRVIGCRKNDDTECNIDETKFVDSSAPNYKILDMGQAPDPSVMASACDCPDGCGGSACSLDQTASVGSRSAVVRLGDTGGAFSCADVRAMVDAKYPGTDF